MLHVGEGGLGICAGWGETTTSGFSGFQERFYLDICCYGCDAVFQKTSDSTFLPSPAQDWELSPFFPLLHVGLSGSFASVPADSFFQAHILVWLCLLEGAAFPQSQPCLSGTPGVPYSALLYCIAFSLSAKNL